MVRNVALLTACHAQPAGKVTLTCPAPPSDAKDALVGLITAGGFEAVKLAVEELLAFDGSRTGEVTDAVLPIIVLSATAQLRVATNVIVAEAPDASEVNETVRLLPVPPQTPPAVDEHETKVSEEDRLSVTVIDWAGSGPLFVTITVYVTLLPTVIVGDDAVFATARSAAPYATHAENSDVFP